MCPDKSIDIRDVIGNDTSASVFTNDMSQNVRSALIPASFNSRLRLIGLYSEEQQLSGAALQGATIVHVIRPLIEH